MASTFSPLGIELQATGENAGTWGTKTNTNLLKKIDEIEVKERKKPRYTPLSKRQDRPDAILWLCKNAPELTDGQISKLVGSTKGTVSLIRKRSYWNFSNLKPRDPVILSLCTQEIYQKALDKAKRRVEREKKAKLREEFFYIMGVSNDKRKRND